MTSVANLQPDPAPLLACTISRDVQNFDLLIDEMELELGEAWGDLGFEDALVFFGQPDAAGLEFVAIAVNGADEADLATITDIIKAAKLRSIKVILIADQVSPIALHQMLCSRPDGDLATGEMKGAQSGYPFNREYIYR